MDGTIGGGGHTMEILDASGPEGRVIGIDRDGEAVAAAERALSRYGKRVTVVRDNYSNMKEVLSSLGVTKVDGIVLDLGVSSHQLDTSSRGFSFRSDDPLDMRMDDTETLTAAHIVNERTEKELAGIFKVYGEERYARRVARAVVREREKAPIETTGKLAAIVTGAVPGPKGPRREKIHPATRVFQALRIVVNDELEGLKRGLAEGVEVLSPGGRYVVISFHSLEDRIVKHFFRDLAMDCICPPSAPVCICDRAAKLSVLTKRVVVADASEVERNPRARSAKLRAAVRL